MRHQPPSRTKRSYQTSESETIRYNSSRPRDLKMIDCTVCGKANSLDSTFCRGCGTKLSSDAIDQARKANMAIVGQGREFLAEGRADEAEIAAREAIAQDGENVAALALLGDALEKKGNYEEALSCYEKVLELNPDSTLDRIRMTHLRKALAGAALEAPEPVQSSRAMWVGVMAALLVVSVGATLVLLNDRAGTQADLAARTPAAATLPEGQVPTPPPAAQQLVPAPDPASAPPSQTQEPMQSPLTTPDRSVAHRVGPPLPQVGGQLPNVLAGAQPLTPFPLGIEVVPAPNPAAAFNPPIGATTAPPVNPDEPVPLTPQPEEQRSPAVISIRPSQPPAQTRGGAQAIPDGGPNVNPRGTGPEAESLLRVARERFALGQWDSAADAYRRALAAGADPVTANQRLAQSYEKLGRRGEAIAAYQRAIQVIQQRLRDGIGDRQWLQATLASCEQALRVLQGP